MSAHRARPAAALLFALASHAAAAQPIALPAAAGASCPGIARTRDGAVVSWIEQSGEKKALRVARLTARGVGPASTVAESPRLVANWADTPSVAEGPRGEFWAHWTEHREGDPEATDVVLGRSRDGKTWTRVGPAHDDGTATEHGFATLLPTRPALTGVWLDGRDTAKDGGAMTLRWGEAGGRGGGVLDGRVCDCCGTGGAVAGAGAVVAYRDRGDDERRDISIVRQLDGGWTPPQSLHDDGWKTPACPVNGPAVAASGRTVAVAWYTYAGSRGRVRVAFSKDSGARFGPPIEVDADGERSAPLGRVDLALDDAGDALVSWVATEREAARLWVRRVSAAGRVGRAVEVASLRASRQGGFPRLERVGKDLVLVWTEWSGEESRVRATRLALGAVPRADQAPKLPGRTTSPALPAAPLDLAVERLDGAKATLRGAGGRAVLLNFWATWCEPCRTELPALGALAERHRKKGLRVVGVSVDQALSKSAIAAFAQKRKVPYELWHDSAEALSGAMGVGVLPATFLLDARGQVRWHTTGAVSADDPGLAAALEQLLAGDAGR